MQSNIIQHTLNETFGHKEFKGLQQEIIEHLIEGNDALVVMATGAGKSLCYQLAGLIREGVTVVISPLIALMKEQVLYLEQLGLKAVCVHAALSWQEVEELESQLLMGDLDYLYLSPEKLLNEEMLNLLHRIDIALFAIDEAHCIWRWGEQFRPEYQQLSLLAEQFPRVPRVALTATAGKICREAVASELALHDSRLFEDELDRKNLYFWVQPKKSAKEQLHKFIRQRHQHHSGIVYCQTRKKAQDIAGYLRQQEFEVGYYHAGMTAEDRWRVQHKFLKGQIKIMVATVAFGMGINKPDIRFVAHMDLPRNLESYFQEVGRAGRDGLAADAWMVFGLRDVQLLSQWIKHSEHDENRKQWEREQLVELIHYVIDGNCRRKNLLPVFGIETQDNCYHCDNCNLSHHQEKNSELSAQALSAVFRCGQNVGIDYLIKVLRGKLIKLVTENNHQQLSVFGIGKAFSEIYWRAVFFQLLRLGAIELHGEYCERVKLTTKSKPLLNFSTSFAFYKFHFFNDGDYLSHRIYDLKYDKNDDSERAADLYQMLWKKRLELATENKLLDYQIVPDGTLKDLCAQMPLKLTQLARVEGFARETIRRYGEQFVRVIQFCQQQQKEQLTRLLSFLPKQLRQQHLEAYALEHQITLQQLALQITRYIQLNLVHAKDILPVTEEEVRRLKMGWKFSHPETEYTPARKYLGQHTDLDIHPCWIPCFFAEFM